MDESTNFNEDEEPRRGEIEGTQTILKRAAEPIRRHIIGGWRGLTAKNT
jgi:hypothetical protein